MRMLRILELTCLVAAAGAGCSNTTASEPAQVASATPAIAEAPRTEPAVQKIAAPSLGLELTGTATPARTAKLSAKGSGILKSIAAREGDRVRAGAVLCSLDGTDIELRVEQAKVAHEQAEEAFNTAKKDFDRNEQLYKAGVLTGSTWEKVEMALRMAELGKKQAEVGLKMGEQALSDTRLRAPFGGVVTKLLAEEGQYITSMPPTVILVLVDTDTLEVRVPVPERHLSQVKAGVPVEVLLPSVKIERRAKIDRIASVVDPMTRAAEAIIRLDNRDRALPAGIYARVRFPTVRDDRSQPDNSTAEISSGGSAP